MTRPLEINPEKYTFGYRVKILRKKLGMTLEKLSEVTRISVGQIKNIESCKTNFSMDSLKRVAIALECTSDYLLGLDEHPGPKWKDR